MKKLLLIFCLCLIFPLNIPAEQKFVGSTLTRNSDFPILRPIGVFLIKIFGKKKKRVAGSYIYNVKDVTLSRTEIIADCSVYKNYCADSAQMVEVFSESDSRDSGNVIIYNYQVTGGKILEEASTFETMGNKARIVWDLSGVKPGIYTISVSIDNSCGSCGRTVTKEIKIIECQGCN